MDDVFLESQPPGGVGMSCSAVKAFSYGEVKATRSQLTITPKDINGETPAAGSQRREQDHGLRAVRDQLQALTGGGDRRRNSH